MTEQQALIGEQNNESGQSRAAAPEPAATPAGERGGVAAGDVMKVTLANADVTPAQAQALVALSQGASLADASVAAKVDRGTLYRWRTRDRNFIAVLNAWRADQQSSARDKLLTLTNQAVAAVSRGLADGDGRLGLRVLEKLESAQIGPTSPTFPREIFGPGISDDDADRLWEELKEAIMNLPEIRRPAAAQIIRHALEVEAKWGMSVLAGLARTEQFQLLDEDQSSRAGAMVMAQIRHEESVRAMGATGAL